MRVPKKEGERREETKRGNKENDEKEEQVIEQYGEQMRNSTAIAHIPNTGHRLVYVHRHSLVVATKLQLSA